MSESNPTTERDALAYAAIDRLPKFERRIIALAYGLPSAGGSGASMHLDEVAATLRSGRERIERRHGEAIEKLAAVLGTDAPHATFQLFRMATKEAILRKRMEEFMEAMVLSR